MSGSALDPDTVSGRSLGRMDSIVIDGRVRTFTVVGEREGPAGRPLVIVLHGSRQTAAGHRRFTGGAWDALAADGGAVVAFLDGYRGHWNDARRGSAFPARTEGVDDVAFVRAVVAELAASHRIDPARVLGGGYSNGGQLVLRILHEAPEVLAGAVLIGATMPAGEDFLAPTPIPAPAPVPILLVHGTDDPIVPSEGGRHPRWVRRILGVDGVGLSAPDTARYFARRNGIETPPVSVPLTTAGRHQRTWTEQTDHRQDGHPPVRLLTVHRGGHTVPGPGRAPFILGRTERRFSTAAATDAFLGITTGSSTSSRPRVESP